VPTSTTPHQPTEPLIVARSIFDRILVGVDGTDGSYEACRQVACLAEADAAINAAAVVHLDAAVAEALAAAEIRDTLGQEADAALDQAVAILGGRAQTCRLDGFVTPSLLGELRRFDTTLVALGPPRHRRATEILIGGVAGEMIHKAPCSVLIARPTEPGAFPRRVVIGYDGSPNADAALFVATGLAKRFASGVRVITALGGKRVELARAELRSPFVETINGHPVTTLVEASRDADLVVVGSRGLHGVRAMGSVSERVAYQAACSVLVVRFERPEAHNSEEEQP
jgi:nucleotide-binding universal stress UspA family protein